MQNESCKECRFWTADGEPVTKYDEVRRFNSIDQEWETRRFPRTKLFGRCKRYPPRFPVDEVDDLEDGHASIEKNEFLPRARYPVTDEEDWCGEFKRDS